MPHDGSLGEDPGILAGDELYSIEDNPIPLFSDAMFRIARGFQNTGAPWGGAHWGNLYKGIRDCNIFLENIGKVPDLTEIDRERWTAEAIFLKAYYHFYLLRMYGPIPLSKENLPISATPEEVKVSRNTVDDCFSYIVELLDQAIPGLTLTIVNPTDELGRITKPIAATLKAKILVTAASPLFNGNTDQATLVNNDGTKLFNQDVVPAKWDSAVIACKRAIELCHEANIGLYEYQTRATLSDTIMRELTIRHTFADKWNDEIIWANTQTSTGECQNIQQYSSPNLDAVKYFENFWFFAQLQPPLKIAEMYYTNHGVPIEDDKSWQSVDRFALRTGGDADSYYIKKGYTTIQLHFEREPRFYACLGFDGGIWYGQRIYGNDPSEYFYVACRMGGLHQKRREDYGPFTGYYWKKCIHYESNQPSMMIYTRENYPWTILRLADLYLLYAEAINEAEGTNGPNSSDLFHYIDLVRAKAGLEGVKYSYDNYASTKKYETQIGMQQIIHRERLIELSLEGQRFWDLRRWKEAPNEYAKNMVGYSVMESDPEKFYTQVTLLKQPFALRDYFWPISTLDIETNTNLVQNIGW
jgi:hypothetical protein